MKIIRIIIFVLSAVLTFWLLAPLYKGVLHIGMLYPLPILGLVMFFSVKPQLVSDLFQKAKGLMIISVSLIGVGIIIFSSLVCVMAIKANSKSENNCTVVILGCQVTGSSPSLMLYDRTMCALEYIKKNPESYIIASGGKGQGENISEAQAIKDLLVSRGVEPSRIILEDKSTNTKENIAFSSEIIKEKNLDKNIAIVTDGFHQFRADCFAKKSDLNACSVTCRTRWYFSFSYYSREVLALLKMVFFK